MRRRYSCRTYETRAIAAGLRATFPEFLASLGVGPLGTRGRFKLVAAADEDRAALKGLGTYGFIKNPPGFVVGAVEKGPKALEDYGYLLERAVLQATDLGLDTCWLGGPFSKSSFAAAIALDGEEVMPAVLSIGHAAGDSRSIDRKRQRMGSSSRLPADKLFFAKELDRPITADAAGTYAEVLEGVRWAPSASNKQPWRIVLCDGGWHFYLERTKGYGKGTLLFTILRLADLQRVDLGIAMCHFELAARALGQGGGWSVAAPPLVAAGREYIATWRPR